jgi:hypothetical protein
VKIRREEKKKKCRKTEVFRHNRYRGDSILYVRAIQYTVTNIIPQKKKKRQFFCRFSFFGGLFLLWGMG